MLTAAAACVGTIGILFTMAFMNGLTRGMIESATDWGLGHVQLRPEGYLETRKQGTLLPQSALLREKLLEMGKDDGKTRFHFAGRLEREGLIRIGGRSLGVILLGVEPESEALIGGIARNVTQGVFFGPENERDRAFGIVSCLLGVAAAKKLEVVTGDTIVVSFTDHHGDSVSVRARIRGVFAAPSPSLERGLVYLSRKDLARLFAGNESAVSYFVIEGSTLGQASRIRDRVRALPPGRGVEVFTWGELEPMLPRTIELSDQFSWIAYVILMLGFALILFEAVMMSVFERTQEIGMIRAIGAGPGLVFWMVEFESILVSVFGCLVGFALGGAVILYLDWVGLPLGAFSEGLSLLGRASISDIHPYLRFRDFVAGLSVGIVTAAIAGVYPSIRAVRLTPLEAILRR